MYFLNTKCESFGLMLVWQANNKQNQNCISFDTVLQIEIQRTDTVGKQTLRQAPWFTL